MELTGLPYSASFLDRASYRRVDANWLAERLDDTGNARLVAVWGDKCLVSGGCVTADPARNADLRAISEPVFLGVDGDTSMFAVDLSSVDEPRALRVAGADRAEDVRALTGSVSADEAALLAYARGLLYWNRNQAYCGICGSKTLARDGGHVRECADEDCGTLHFPRIAPAVIMLVESAQAPRRCLLARHRGSATGSFSLLAGFVEIGENLEDAVRREVAEEAGVAVGPVGYLASQAWPFPSGLMLGFLARATDDHISADDKEILEARWFTEAEIADRALGRPDSIDRRLIAAWLDGQGG
jgi:NAD+ diphosphatase